MPNTEFCKRTMLPSAIVLNPGISNGCSTDRWPRPPIARSLAKTRRPNVSWEGSSATVPSKNCSRSSQSSQKRSSDNAPWPRQQPQLVAREHTTSGTRRAAVGRRLQLGVGPCRQESMLSLPPQRIAENLTRVKERMAEVATACGRQPEQILLVAVTKYVGVAEAQAITAAGCRDLGESRPQELWQKAAAAELADIRWHLVGHLQRNKVRRTLPLLSLLHSLDSDRRSMVRWSNLPCRSRVEVLGAIGPR